MEVRIYLQMLKRGWWIILLSALTAVTVSLFLSFVASPQYRSKALIIISPNASIDNSRDVVNSLDTLDRRSIVSTYAEVLGSNSIYQETLNKMQLKPTDLDAYTRAAVVLPDAFVMELSVEGPNPVVATQLTNALGREAITYTRRLNQVYTMDFLDLATVPVEPISPMPVRDASLALALGIVAGGILTIVREQIREPIDAIRRRSMIDPVSSALNRRTFQRTLEGIQARSSYENVGLGLIQLDGLTGIFETLPPRVTQKLMHIVTAQLREHLRGNDQVGRWDELQFAVLLPATPKIAAERTLERICQALSKPIYVEHMSEPIQLEPYVSVVVGELEETAQSMIVRAEKALDVARQKYLTENKLA